jgi:outer membrane protein assembly factor BamD (BamD/ComL family)
VGKRKRITKKQLKHDALLESASKTTRYIEEHRNTVLIGAAILVVAVLIGTMVIKARRATGLEANAALVDATQLLNTGQLAQAAEQLQIIQTDYAGTRSAAAATCYLGAVAFHQADYDQALQYFEQYLSRYGSDRNLRRIALEGKAAVLEQQRDFQTAADTYRQLATEARANEPAYSRYMMDAVRCYRSIPDWEAVRTTALEIPQTYPDSYLAPDARMAAAEAQERLASS